MLSRAGMRIENARLYPAAVVNQLEKALSNGAELCVDAARRNFYDLEAEGRTYFIYVAPVSGYVTLIAMWDKKRSVARGNSDGKWVWWRRLLDFSS